MSNIVKYPQVEQLETDSLHFDPFNPRLAEYGIENGLKEEEILDILWNSMDVMELIQSIAASGFFAHEAIVVAKESGKNIVIEGNRRLAAVKILLNPNLAKEKNWPIPKIKAQIIQTLRKLPAIVSTREESWRFLGFKHVNGPAKWGSYAKAVYIAEVHRKYKVPLELIAEQIGDRHRTVQRLFRGLMVLEQAERERVFLRDDRFNTRFAFSHLYTGIDYDGISQFIGLNADSGDLKNPVPKNKIKSLGELCKWMYGSKKDDKAPLVQSQNPDLRNLNAVVSNREALDALRSNAPLEKALEISRNPVAVFESALLAAKRALTTARAYLTTGYDNTEGLLKIAGSVANLADDVYEEMERKKIETHTKGKKSRISE